MTFYTLLPGRPVQLNTMLTWLAGKHIATLQLMHDDYSYTIVYSQVLVHTAE